MLSRQEEMLDRKRTLENDLKVRRQQEERRRTFAPDQSLPRQGTTFHQHAINDADIPRGRFSAISNATVVGSTAIPQYPQASAPFQSDPVPDEPPLSFDNPALEPSSSCSAQAPGPTPDDPSPLGRGVGPLSQSGDPAGSFAQPTSHVHSERVAGSLPTNNIRRRV
jgi:hypothetical protein